MDVRAGLALEAQRIFEVEGDDGIARELEHEVAQRADRDLPGDDRAALARRAKSGACRLRLRGGDELVDQVVGLDAEALAAADFDVGLSQVFRRHVVAKSTAQRGVSATIS